MVRLPPRYVNVPVWVAYGDLSASVLRTGIRIWGLGWQYNYERTGKVTIEELCDVCGVGRSQLYGHLQQLVVKGVLRYTSTAGVFVFDLRPGHQTGTIARAGPSPENRTGSALFVVVDSSPDLPDSERSKVLEEREQQQQVVSSLEGGEWGGSGVECGKPHCESGKPDWAERVAVLDRMGVLEPTRSEILGLEWATAEYLEAWEDWWIEEFWSAHFDGSGLGLVIEQVRAGIEAPATRTTRRLERYAEQFGEWQ